MADVRRREQSTPSGGARDRWRPEKVLTRVGVSIQMAGKDIVQDILDKNAETIRAEKKAIEEKAENSEAKNGIDQNGTHELVKELSPDVNSLHPVAAIQVSPMSSSEPSPSLYTRFRPNWCSRLVVKG